MRLTRKQRREQRNNKLLSREAELNIVSMIDVFAVLVFFLLVNSSIAANSLNVISLNLPAAEETPPPPPKEPPLALQVAIYKDRLVLSSRDGTHPLPDTPAGHDLASLTSFLVDIKRRNPSELNITVAMEPDTPYDDLVQVMDAARIAPAEARAQGLPREMFPNIALADIKAETAPGAAP